MTPTETKTIIRTYRQPMPLTILQRLDKKDKTAVKDCLDTYGNVIWALAKKFTSTIDEAETATAEIFTDVWRYARKGGTSYSTEGSLIAHIAWDRLVKRCSTVVMPLF